MAEATKDLPADKPPKKVGLFEPKAEGEKRGRGRPVGSGVKSPLIDRLREALGAIGIGVCLINEADGLAVVEGADRLARALDKLAKQNPGVRRVLETMLTGGAYGELAFACAAIALPIMANHRLLPAAVLPFTGSVILGSNGSDSGSGGGSAHRPESGDDEGKTRPD